MENERTTRAGSKRRAETGGTGSAWQPQRDAGDGGAVEQAKARVEQIADKAQQQASEKARSALAQGKARAADTLSGVASSLLLSSQQLREQNHDSVSRYIERAATQLDHAAHYLQTAEPGELVDRVESFARRQPALFIGGAFALGLLGARFLKSSRRDRATVGWQYDANGLSARVSYPADREIAQAPEVDSAIGGTTTPYAPGYGAREI